MKATPAHNRQPPTPQISEGERSPEQSRHLLYRVSSVARRFITRSQTRTSPIETSADPLSFLGERDDFATQTLRHITERALHGEVSPNNPNYRKDIVAIARGESLGEYPLYPICEVPEFGVDSFLNKSNPGMMRGEGLEYREMLIDTYVRNPDTATTLVKHGIVGLHISGSASLLSSLEHGLKPLDELRAGDHEVHNGARDANGIITQGTSFIRFISSATVAMGWFQPRPLEETIQSTRELVDSPHYPEETKSIARKKLTELLQTKEFVEKTPQSPEEAEKQQLIAQNFPIIWGLSHYGVSSEGVREGNFQGQLGYVLRRQVPSEFIIKNLKPTDTPVLLVPRAKVEEVEKLVAQKPSRYTVLAVEDTPIAKVLGY